MPVPRCPVCGCDADDLSQRETRAAPQSPDKSEAAVVICHCTQSHRFVVSLVEIADGAEYEASGMVPDAPFPSSNAA
jgi:hypothetical protein